MGLPKKFDFVLLILILTPVLAVSGCMFPTVKLFTDASDPLKECVLEGEEDEKVLVVPVYGIISDIPRKSLMKDEPSMVQDIVSQLRLAEADPDIRAVVFKIDSPGGSVTASDVLYHEILTFKQRTGVKVAAVIMNAAASGGYYIALPADWIMAHPTSITGSVGVIFLQPRFYEFMDKIGVGVDASTSGENKDMGSPFRAPTAAEEKIFQNLTESLGRRFLDLVTAHRRLSPDALADVATARIYLAHEALELGLIDDIGYLNHAIAHAKTLAGIPETARVVIYRRTEYPDDNLYNIQSVFPEKMPRLIDLGLPDSGFWNRAGFYYLWPAGIGGE